MQRGAVCRRGAAVRARVGALLAAGGRRARRPGAGAGAHGRAYFCRAARARSCAAAAHMGRPRPRRTTGDAHAGARILALPRQPALSRHRARRLHLRRRARPRRAARVSAGLPACGARDDAARPVGHLRGAADIGAVLCGRGVRGLPAAAARPAAPAGAARAAVSRARTGQLFLRRTHKREPVSAADGGSALSRAHAQARARRAVRGIRRVHALARAAADRAAAVGAGARYRAAPAHQHPAGCRAAARAAGLRGVLLHQPARIGKPLSVSHLPARALEPAHGTVFQHRRISDGLSAALSAQRQLARRGC